MHPDDVVNDDDRVVLPCVRLSSVSEQEFRPAPPDVLMHQRTVLRNGAASRGRQDKLRIAMPPGDMWSRSSVLHLWPRGQAFADRCKCCIKMACLAKVESLIGRQNFAMSFIMPMRFKRRCELGVAQSPPFPLPILEKARTNDILP